MPRHTETAAMAFALTPARPIAPPPLTVASIVRSPQAVHMTQYSSSVVPDALPLGNTNCGPTSAVIALRLLGLDVPGFHGERTEQVIDAARMIATGSPRSTDGTTKNEQARVLITGGANVQATRSLEVTLDAVRNGAVAVLGGDFNADRWRALPSRPRINERIPAPHALVVSAYDAASQRFWVNDPMLTTPRSVTAEDIASFTSTNGSQIMKNLALIATR